MVLNRSDLLKAVTKIKTIDVEGIGQVCVKQLPASVVLTLSSLDQEQGAYRMLAASICDEEGLPMFKEEEVKDLFPMDALTKLVNAAFEVNNLTEEADKKLVGESGQTTSTDSVSS